MENRIIFENEYGRKIETETMIPIRNGRKLPIGIQDFENLRNDNYVYVDKTEYIYKLVHYGKPYFLSRPRRFGKSLFLSTLSAYWEGKRHLFSGLHIEGLEADNPHAWEPYPVLYFDFNKDDYSSENALENVLDEHLKRWEKDYKIPAAANNLGERFRNVIEKAREDTGKRVVVLIDEYDKPLIDVATSPQKQEHNKSVFKSFFSTLKSYDKYLMFVFVTGVTKFSKVSIFSDLNQLQDISMDEEYAGICGIMESELELYFEDEINQLASHNQQSYEQCRQQLKKMYDGYHFHYRSEDIYNPFSIMNAFRKRDYREYWFSTGTPTLLVDRLIFLHYKVEKFTSDDLYVNPRSISDYIQDDKDPLPLLYQTGYLTIKDYDETYNTLKLGYPNDEVKYAFIESLLPAYLSNDVNYDPTDVRSFGLDIEDANLESMKKRFQALFAKIPYPVDRKMVEWNYQIVIYLVFTLLGKSTKAEVHMTTGRIDCVVEAKKYVYLFEFKVDKSADAAIEQIHDNHYADIYCADKRQVFEIGVNFNSESRNIDQWEVRS